MVGLVWALLVVACEPEWAVEPWYSQMVCPSEAHDSVALRIETEEAAYRMCARFFDAGGNLGVIHYERSRCVAGWSAQDSTLWLPVLHLELCAPWYLPDGRRPGYPGFY